MSESVNARTDGQTHGLMHRHQLESHPISSPRAFGSGELNVFDTNIALFMNKERILH